jgi:hypothetical protein
MDRRRQSSISREWEIFCTCVLTHKTTPRGKNGFHDVNYSKRKRGGPGFGHALANLQKGKQDMMAWRVRHIGQYP